LGAVARNGRIIRVGDLRREALFRGFPGGHPEMGSFLGAPIAYRGRPVGNLYLANQPGNRAFSEKDERIIRMLATRVGVAIETARIYAGERFHRSWLQNIIDQMPNGVVLYDERGRLKAMNQAISNLSCEPTGCTDAYGNPIIFEVLEPDGSAIPPEDLPMGRALCTQEATIHKEALIRPRDGRLVPVSLSAVPVRGPNGKVSGVTVLVEDITERKELERLREEWAAVVAHDLRQPASVITLAADVLLKLHAEEWSDADRRTVERIRCAAEHLNRLISDLTDASLVESKRLSVEPEVVDLEALVHTVVESLEAATAGYDVEIRVEGEPQAWVDPDRIRQVLVNLVTNAAKYGRRGTVIRVDLVRRDDSVEVTVTNEGLGIPPNDLDRLFVRFARTRGARKSKATGLGLGLYIARGIVEAHGGRIWAESIPGQTTAFHVRLPGHPPEVATGARDTGADS
ncbi:MAG TPA: ATP-binding protein, partial [Labilithrix sp.]|nr:ATP-binding protein [Labilithrix sp.]